MAASARSCCSVPPSQVSGVWRLWAVQSDIAYMTVQSSNALRAGEIAEQLHAIRRAVLRYAFDQDEASSAEAEKRMIKTAPLLDEAIKTTTSAERRATYTEIKSRINELNEKRLALGEAGKQMVAARALLFTDGDQMAADVQKFVDAAAITAVALEAGSLDSKVLLVRVANWRLLATRDQKGVAIFKSNAAKARQVIEALERADLSSELVTLLRTVKADLGKYSEAFEKASSNLLLGDELYYKSIAPLITKAVEDLDAAKAGVAQHANDTSREAAERIAGTVTMQEIVAGIAALFGLLVAFFIARGITGPLAELVSDAARLSGGDTSAEFKTASRGDEIGQVAGAVAKFRDNVIAQQQAAKAFSSEVEAREALNRDMEGAVEGFRISANELLATVGENAGVMKQTAEALTGIAGEATQQAAAAATASEQTASNVQTVAAAAEQLTSSIGEIGRQIELSNSTVRTAGIVTARSETEIEGLAKAAQSISSVVDLIQAIAAQTNLLALNATI
jgi:methyl-accepting chemotaxis protein